MDSEFERRWRKGEKPFDGVTVYLEDYVALADLRPMLIPLVQLLFAHYPQVKLFRLLDWHEHDGFINEAMPATWQELLSLLESEEALRKASAGDYDVRTAFFPENREFLLRLDIPDIYENPFHSHDDPQLVHYGLFDLTSHEMFALQARDAIQELGAVAVKTIVAKKFFDRSYGG